MPNRIVNRASMLKKFAFGLLVALALAPCTVAEETKPSGKWSQVVPGLLVSSGIPCSYALVEEDAALVVGASRGADPAGLQAHGVKSVELVLLTHHDRDTTARAAELVKAKIPVRAGLLAADLLTLDGVRKFWQIAMPLPTPGREPPLRERTFQDWIYLVHPEGIDGIDCTLREGHTIDWRSWKIDVLETPGPARDHLAFMARRSTGKASNAEQVIAFCGDLVASPGKVWTPYTTDWEHWTPKGLQETYQSLRRVALANPTLLCPEHGAPIVEDVAGALRTTGEKLAHVAELKSFEQFSKQRLGNPPQYKLVAPEQVGTVGEDPWSQLSPHLFLTGNTYALTSKSGAGLLLDVYGPRVVEQIHKLRQDHKLGPVEMVLISHAHNDHFKGIYLLPNRPSFAVGTIRQVAFEVENPYYFCAPYLDARPLKVDRPFRDGEKVRWQEYEFTIHHLPGQTLFAMGLEVTIDGKRCFFTADNFYHADQYTGSGGWSGRNRGLPPGYAASAQKILSAAPDWVLAEHGGAFEFNQEDFKRRVAWAKAAAAGADALSPSGQHVRDWDPYRVHFEPMLQSIARGKSAKGTLVVSNPTSDSETVLVQLDGRSLVADQDVTISVGPGASERRELTLAVSPTAAAGRHVFPLVIQNGEAEDGSDAFLVIDVQQ